MNLITHKKARALDQGPWRVELVGRAQSQRRHNKLYILIYIHYEIFRSGSGNRRLSDCQMRLSLTMVQASAAADESIGVSKLVGGDPANGDNTVDVVLMGVAEIELGDQYCYPWTAFDR